MIIWIASYPKSGNTWVRALITAYLYSKDGIFNFKDLDKIEQFPSNKYLNSYLKNSENPGEISQYWIAAQKEINSENQTKFFKTHNALCSINGNSFTDKKNTLATVYIVRDPRNVITSLSNHYGLSIDKAYDFFTNKRKIIFGKNIFNEEKLYTQKGNVHLIGSWEEHYTSWKNISFAPIKIIKYEDLIDNTYSTFFSILKFLNNFYEITIYKKKIEQVIKACSFDVLKKKEEKEGFLEASNSKNSKKIIFFNLGKNNNWKKILSSTIERKINTKFSKEMKELGYL